MKKRYTNSSAAKESQKQSAIEKVRPLTTEEKRHAIVLFGFGWLVPGSGHWYIGQIGKGILFFVLLNGLFLWGMLLRGEIVFPVVQLSSPAFNIVNIFIFIFGLGNGLLSILELTPWLHVGNITAVTYEVGTLFMVVSGALNFFVVLDAFDTFRNSVRQITLVQKSKSKTQNTDKSFNNEIS